MSSKAAVSCVIVTHNSARELAHLFDSIEAHLGSKAEVIVVDSGSSDTSLTLADERGAVTKSLPDNPGFGTASNLGVSLANTDVTALLNPDVVLQDDSILRLAESARRSNCIYAPRLLNQDGTIQRSAHPIPGQFSSFIPAFWPPSLMPQSLAEYFEPWRCAQPVTIGWAIGAALVARTDTLKTLGPFDPNVFLYYEDMELCIKARKNQIPTVLRPDVALTHSGAHSTESAFDGEPFELLARRRGKAIKDTLGINAARIDRLTQQLIFITRLLAKRALRRDASRERAQFRALLKLSVE